MISFALCNDSHAFPGGITVYCDNISSNSTTFNYGPGSLKLVFQLFEDDVWFNSPVAGINVSF